MLVFKPKIRFKNFYLVLLNLCICVYVFTKSFIHQGHWGIFPLIVRRKFFFLRSRINLSSFGNFFHWEPFIKVGSHNLFKPYREFGLAEGLNLVAILPVTFRLKFELRTLLTCRLSPWYLSKICFGVVM